MDGDPGSLARFATHNPKGRLLFLGVPVGAAALAHAVALALGVPVELAPIFGCIVSLFAVMASAWLWLDEHAAIAMERVYGRGAFIAAAMMLPAMMLGAMSLGMATLAAALMSFGALGGTVRITAYSDAPEPPEGSKTLAWMAWSAQCAVVIAILSTPNALVAAVVTVSFTVATAAALVFGEKPLQSGADLG